MRLVPDSFSRRVVRGDAILIFFFFFDDDEEEETFFGDMSTIFSVIFLIVRSILSHCSSIGVVVVFVLIITASG